MICVDKYLLQQLAFLARSDKKLELEYILFSKERDAFNITASDGFNLIRLSYYRANEMNDSPLMIHHSHILNALSCTTSSVVNIFYNNHGLKLVADCDIITMVTKNGSGYPDAENLFVDQCGGSSWIDGDKFSEMVDIITYIHGTEIKITSSGTLNKPLKIESKPRNPLIQILMMPTK